MVYTFEQNRMNMNRCEQTLTEVNRNEQRLWLLLTAVMLLRSVFVGSQSVVADTISGRHSLPYPFLHFLRGQLSRRIQLRCSLAYRSGLPASPRQSTSESLHVSLGAAVADHRLHRTPQKYCQHSGCIDYHLDAVPSRVSSSCSRSHWYSRLRSTGVRGRS
jgi:hypothetical protein